MTKSLIILNIQNHIPGIFESEFTLSSFNQKNLDKAKVINQAMLPYGHIDNSFFLKNKIKILPNTKKNRLRQGEGFWSDFRQFESDFG